MNVKHGVIGFPAAGFEVGEVFTPQKGIHPPSQRHSAFGSYRRDGQHFRLALCQFAAYFAVGSAVHIAESRPSFWAVPNDIASFVTSILPAVDVFPVLAHFVSSFFFC